MLHFLPMHGAFRRSLLTVTVASGVLSLILLAGCGGGITSSSSTSKSKQPQTYMAPYVVGTTNGSGSLLGQLTQTQIYAIDDTANAFSQSIFGLVSAVQGPQAINVGNVTTDQRGLLDLGITANYAPSGGIYVATDYSPTKSGSFALELAGQTGGLVQIVGQRSLVARAADGFDQCRDVGLSGCELDGRLIGRQVSSCADDSGHGAQRAFDA